MRRLAVWQGARHRGTVFLFPRRALAAFPALALPRMAEACAVCFGADDGSGLARAFAWAVAILTGLTFAILGILVYAVWRIEERRASRGFGAAPEADLLPKGAGDGLPHTAVS